MPPKKSKTKLNSAALDLLGKDIEVLDEDLEEINEKKKPKGEEKKVKAKKVKENNVLIWLNRATKGLSSEQMETLANLEFFGNGSSKGEKIFPQEQSQELLEVVNLLKTMDFDELMEFLNDAIKTSKTVEGVRYKIVFSNPTLKKQNAVLRQQEELQLNKSMIRKGIYKCPDCQKYNTMHWSAITRGDEAGIINVICMRCKKPPFRPAQ